MRFVSLLLLGSVPVPGYIDSRLRPHSNSKDGKRREGDLY